MAIKKHSRTDKSSTSTLKLEFVDNVKNHSKNLYQSILEYCAITKVLEKIATITLSSTNLPQSDEPSTPATKPEAKKCKSCANGPAIRYCPTCAFKSRNHKYALKKFSCPCEKCYPMDFNSSSTYFTLYKRYKINQKNLSNSNGSTNERNSIFHQAVYQSFTQKYKLQKGKLVK